MGKALARYDGWRTLGEFAGISAALVGGLLVLALGMNMVPASTMMMVGGLLVVCAGLMAIFLLWRRIESSARSAAWIGHAIGTGIILASVLARALEMDETDLWIMGVGLGLLVLLLVIALYKADKAKEDFTPEENAIFLGRRRHESNERRMAAEARAQRLASGGGIFARINNLDSPLFPIVICGQTAASFAGVWWLSAESVVRGFQFWAIPAGMVLVLVGTVLSVVLRGKPGVAARVPLNRKP